MKDIIRITHALEFAARKHVNQKRKGKREEPYVNHVAEVARMLAEATAGKDTNLVIAGLLHDTIEDTKTKHRELVRHFGRDVADLVREVTDDKKLRKEVRKRRQIDTAPHKSRRAKMIKIADKTANLHSIFSSPPPNWNAERRRKYLLWARNVVAGCRGVNAILDNRFDEAARKLAKLLRVGREDYVLC